MLASTPLQGDKAVKVCRAYFYAGFLFLPWLWGMGWFFFRHFLDETHPPTGPHLDGSWSSTRNRNSCSRPEREMMSAVASPSVDAPHCSRSSTLPMEEEEEENPRQMRKRNTATPFGEEGVVRLSSPRDAGEEWGVSTAPLDIREEKEVEEEEEKYRKQRKKTSASSSSRSSSDRCGLEEKDDGEQKAEHAVVYCPPSRDACGEDAEAKGPYDHGRRRRRKFKNATICVSRTGESGLGEKDVPCSVTVVVVNGEDRGEEEAAALQDDDESHRLSPLQIREEERKRHHKQQAALRWYVLWSRNLFVCSVLLFILMNTIFYLALPASSPFWGDDFVMRWWEELTTRKTS